jgi:pimeloyl-ACP methyl ester carboxylesterase
MRFAAGLVASLVLLIACVTGPAPGPRIEEASYVPIGGIEQWVTIRGDDAKKPVLLLLHGGPGDVQSPFVSVYAPYERHFVLVQWDQRGAGRTFSKNGAAGVSLEKQVADGIELAQQLRARFPKQKLVVMGHSWGSIVATGMAQQRPELFDAYVGTGQVAAWADTVQFQFDFLKERYREKGDTAALARLEAIGKPDPKNVGQYFGFSRPIRQHFNPSDAGWFANMQQVLASNGETEESIKAASSGMNASGVALIAATTATDLPATAASFKIPYYVIQGRHDLFAPTFLAEAYFAKVAAPKKQMIVLEDAGHFALATHAEEVVAALKDVIGQVRNSSLA